MKELTKRFNEKDKLETPDESRRACLEHYNDGFTEDGTYTITSSTRAKLKVYCDMKGGGWTLVGMVHTARDNVKVDEPVTWFTNGNYPESAKLYSDVIYLSIRDLT